MKMHTQRGRVEQQSWRRGKRVTETLNDKENWFNNKHDDNRHWEHKDSQVPNCLVYKQNLHTQPLHNDHDDVKRLFGDVWMSVKDAI